jgi:hypothetical protein
VVASLRAGVGPNHGRRRHSRDQASRSVHLQCARSLRNLYAPLCLLSTAVLLCRAFSACCCNLLRIASWAVAHFFLLFYSEHQTVAVAPSELPSKCAYMCVPA